MKTKFKNWMLGAGALCLLSSFAQADIFSKQLNITHDEGGLVGNGGGTVVCRDAATQKIKKIQVLDFYEASQHPGMKLIIEEQPGDWKKKVEFLLERVHQKSELRYQLYSAWFKTFESEWMLLKDVQMSTVADSGLVGVPKGCAFEQAAIQRKPIFSNDPRYFMNEELWLAMDDSQKAMLVMHELVYREALAYGHTNSIRTRYLNALYASTKYENMSIKEYIKNLDQAHFELVDIASESLISVPVETKLYLDRLWQAGPDQVIPETLNLKSRLVLQLGTCEGHGCLIFNSHRNESDILSESPGNIIRTAHDLRLLQLGRFSIFSLNGDSITISKDHSALLLKTEKNGEFNLVSDDEYSLDQAIKVALSLEKNNFTLASSVSRNVKKIRENKEEKKAFGLNCYYIHTFFLKGKPSTMISSTTIPGIACNTENSAFLSTVHYSNGSGEVAIERGVYASFDPTTEEISELDTGHTGQLPRALQRDLLHSWRSDSVSVLLLNNYGHNCLKAIVGPNRVVQKLTVTCDSMRVGDILDIQFLMKGSTVDLLENGSIQSLVLTRDYAFISPKGELVHARAGQKIFFNENREPVSIEKP